LPAVKKKKTSAVAAGVPPKNRTFIEQARRLQILDAALELFATKGYNETSLSDIAGTLSISKGVISYHFEGKAELGAEAVRHMLRHYGEFVRKRLEGKASLRDKLLELPAACIDFVRENPSSYVVYLDTVGSFGTSADRQQFMAWADAGMRALICDMLTEAQDRKEIPRFAVQPVADVLQAAVDGLTQQASVAPKEVDLESSKRLLQKILAAIFDGRIELARR
jgi:TetR/AcrR family fatty acid metabolism transcriptional regulator